MNENTCICSHEQSEQCVVHKKSRFRNLWKEEEQQVVGEDERSE